MAHSKSDANFRPPQIVRGMVIENNPAEVKNLYDAMRGYWPSVHMDPSVRMADDIHMASWIYCSSIAEGLKRIENFLS